MQYWLHRISHHAEVSHLLLSKNYLTIGFSDFAYTGFIEDILTNGWDAIENAFLERWGERPRTRYNLWHFIHEMKKGDCVVVPSWNTFSIYQLVSERPQIIGEIDISGIIDWNKYPLSFSNNDSSIKLLTNSNRDKIDLGFAWKVEPVATDIPRAKYADALLTSRMKIRNTNSLITTLKDSVDKAVRAYNLKKPINLSAQILEVTVPIVLERLKSDLNPDKFEQLVRWYFQRVGASEASIPSKNEREKEGDADVIAVFESIKTIIYIQVKFHQGETSTWALEQIKAYKDNKELMDDGYSKVSWVVSTADRFSEECYIQAKENKVQLIDGRKLAQMLLEVGLTDLDKAV